METRIARRHRSIAVALLLAAGGAAGSLRPSTGPGSSGGAGGSSPTQAVVDAGFVAYGLVEPVSGIVELRPRRQGTLIETRLGPGGRFAAGDVLAALDHDVLDAHVRSARGETRAAGARLYRLRAGARDEEARAARARSTELGALARAAGSRLALLAAGARPEERDGARARLAEAEGAASEARRVLEERDRLVSRGLLDRSSLDEARSAVAICDARTRASRAALEEIENGARPEELAAAGAEAEAAIARSEAADAARELVVAGARSEEIEEAEAALEAAEGRLLAALAELEETFVRAPFDGTVLYRHLSVGERVGLSGEPALFEVGALGPRCARADVDEFDVGRVRIGQRVEVSAPAFGDERFAGRVVRIEGVLGRKNSRNRHASEKEDSKILEVVVELDEPAARLPIGLPVHVRFAPGDAGPLPEAR